MRIEAQLFAVLRERAGSGSVVAELPEGATVADALAAFGREHPKLGEALAEMPVVMAVNHEYARPDQILHEGDELALVPPVSGGEGRIEAAAGPGEREGRIRVGLSQAPLSLDEAVRFVTVPAAGAVVTFQGVTRRVERLEYEAYAPMAERRMREICERALAEHEVERVAALHRIGEVPLSEPSVIVAASAAHRLAAFVAARDLIDRIKAEAPIWKRERDGDAASWVEGTAPPVEGARPPTMEEPRH